MFRSVPEKFADARAHEGVLPLQIEHQNQIRKTFQQVPAELFLPLQLLFQRALLGDIYQRALVTDNPSGFYYAVRGIHAHRDSAIFSSQSKLASAGVSALASRVSQDRKSGG